MSLFIRGTDVTYEGHVSFVELFYRTGNKGIQGPVHRTKDLHCEREKKGIDTLNLENYEITVKELKTRVHNNSLFTTYNSTLPDLNFESRRRSNDTLGTSSMNWKDSESQESTLDPHYHGWRFLTTFLTYSI